ATDDLGTYKAGNTVTLNVANVAPTLTLSGTATVNENSTYTLNLAHTDPGTDTISKWTITWGDGSTQTVTGNPSSVTHKFFTRTGAGVSAYTISATATDEDGTFTAAKTVGVTVTHVTPALSLSGAAAVNEGATYTLGLSSPAGSTHSISKWTI